ncbi:hypothetical protein [Bizionia argentinensis]|uniref:hypothetical protein n=1 Tax=Bizionia argentinensis TaxID=456455 RepID=UPI0002232D8B|nr:hypothetical protein [Bizionia argentinensis]
MAKKNNSNSENSNNKSENNSKSVRTGLDSRINRSGAESTKGSGSGNRPGGTKKD